ncbi:MAG: cysteine--tRNA ligase ['Candidatus Kapabacteria' thiocyanatum]|uniref:Cysteine--tRNA ligase n=1 Tax=Candidatus Kapaibacterium thiocyanatum TaxID=1895771 RepID=A0A1M3KWT0_9BACT|nr:cysteine--tRNA ligase ['Candidatus Kapabacteria' thiocyanatum]OJX56837.1 MAG: cysteine--tRNA ligase ['Candidatus Kapabacteria' thiocyanatum]
MQIHLYNTLSRSIEPFSPLHADHIRMYSCGPTVYNVAHIGNMRSFLSADIIQRTLRMAGGYDVRWVMNITDIDDKTIRDSAIGSARWTEAMGPQTDDARANLRLFTEYYEREFLADISALGIRKEHFFANPRATDFIDHMQGLIRDIVGAGYGYVSDGSVYFNVNAYRKGHPYGRLFSIDAEHFREGVRIDADEYDRESVSDFVLWKGRKGGEPYWDFDIDGASLPGRPGWHIECSAMSKELLGLPLDIHTGGVDLRFPHHEDELAQCTAGYHVPEQARFWCHNEFLEVEGKKMSKSLGNFFTLRDLMAQGLDALDIRFAMLSSHYRSVYNFTFDGLRAAGVARRKVQDYVWDLLERSAVDGKPSGDHPGEELRTRFFTELVQDVHTPKALAELFSFINAWPAATVQPQDAAAIIETLKTINGIFDVWVFSPRPVVVVPDDVRSVADERWAARTARDWAEADRLRGVLGELGWTMLDGKDGYSLERLS